MTAEEFTAMATQRCKDVQALNKLDNFYDYEKQVVGIRKDSGREALEKSKA